LKAFTRAEIKAGPAVCPSEGDAAGIEALIESCFADLTAALAGTPNPVCVPRAFPATGQTTCWDSAGAVIACAGTGQDGDIRAGAALSYTDNGDGTITDNNTGLMWEKKSNAATEFNYKRISYTWADAFAVHIAGLNAAGFAGYTDWRLPNVKELQTIVNYEKLAPAVSPAFETGCEGDCTVVQCSCTTLAPYWSSTTSAEFPENAWQVEFFVGNLQQVAKSRNDAFVRAVRGGL
jgi:hypothetical protein